MAVEFNPGQALQGGLGFIGGLIDADRARSQANKNRDMQIAFAKKGIQWRVQDAMKAGVHPLAALGASMQGYSPVSVGTDFAGMGQNLGRALSATSNVDDRLSQLTLRNMELRNQLIEGQIAKQQADQLGPSVPVSTSTMMPLISSQGDVVSAPGDASFLRHDYPQLQTVTPPESKVQAQKHFGYTLVPNLRKFSPSQGFTNVFGDEGLGNFIHNTASYLEALGRAFVRYHSPRFEARRREWHGGR